MKIENKIIVITGATKGLGKALAQNFLNRSNTVISSARTKNTSSDQNPNDIFIAADVTSEKEMENLANEVISRFGRINIWINNAGIWHPHSSIEEINMDLAHKMFEVNVFGTMYGSRSALKQMKKQNSGTIVNILSTSGLVGRPTSAAYCASKFAADGFTKSLRLATKEQNISVISVYPDGMQTDIFGDVKLSNYNEFLLPEKVAEEIIDNLEQDKPVEEQIIRGKVEVR